MSPSTITSPFPIEKVTQTKPSLDRISLGLVGLNFGRWIVLHHLLEEPAFTYFHLAALCDTNSAQLDKMTAELGDRFTGKTYATLDEMLDNPEIKVVGLFTGPVKRAELIRKIIRKGRDVITTKPFEIDAEAALAVLKEAGELGRVVVLNSPAPVLRPDLAKIFEWQKTYHLGQPIAARSEATASYVEKADGSWYDKPDLCPVAPIFRIGIYLINDLCNFFHNPESVFVQHSRLRTGRPTPDHAQMGIQYRSGALVNIFASFCVGDGDWYRNSLILNFEFGTVYRDAGAVRSDPARLTLVGCDGGDKRKIIDEVEIPQASDSYSWGKFHDMINGRTPPNLTTAEQIVEGIRIVNAMSRAELGHGVATV
jgi:predicted dehydrogenase